MERFGYLHMCTAVARNQLHPERRTLDKRHGGHVIARTSAEEISKNGADQPHIVILTRKAQEVQRSEWGGKVGMAMPNMKNKDTNSSIYFGDIWPFFGPVQDSLVSTSLTAEWVEFLS